MELDEKTIKKWQPIVDYSSKMLEKTPEHLKMYVSLKLEEWEQKCIEWDKEDKINYLFPKYFIPHVRETLGSPDLEFDVEIDGRSCITINNSLLGRLAIPYKPERDISGMCENDMYLFDEGVWVPFPNSNYL